MRPVPSARASDSTAAAAATDPRRSANVQCCPANESASLSGWERAATSSQLGICRPEKQSSDAHDSADYGSRGYFEKSGFRFSRKAFLPSLPSSVM